MNRHGKSGVTLIELIIAISIMSGIAVTAAALLSTSLRVHAYATDRSELHQEGSLAMARMTSGVRKCTFLLIPNAHNATRDILAFSGSVNEDDDYYFGDPLFPRIDEDLKKQMTDDGKAGILGEDDDGDGAVDEGNMNDDDEDGMADEDPLDGIDNDGDGNIDEDTGDDGNIAGMDDDADGQIDEGDSKDDDEDGTINEDPLNPIIYTFAIGINTLRETDTFADVTVDLSAHVTNFSVTYEAPDATHDPRIVIVLTLTGDDGESITFSEYVYPENTVQKNGKRVR